MQPTEPPRPTDETDPPTDPRLAAWERRMGPWIIAAALVPLAAALIRQEPDDPLTLLDLGTWGLFLADLVVHMRYRRHYLRTGVGRFDAVVVVLSFPWYLIPAFGGSAILGLARLGRVARIVVAGASSGIGRRLTERLGRAGLYAVVLIGLCSEIVYRVEPASSGFTSRGDAWWWGVVTFTTVGYGDLTPVTASGRLAAVLLMIGGIALIGLLAGSLAELFTEEPDEGEDPTGDTDVAAAAGAPHDADGGPDPSRPVADLAAEVRLLRREIAELRAALGAERAAGASAAPPDSP